MTQKTVGAALVLAACSALAVGCFGPDPGYPREAYVGHDHDHDHDREVHHDDHHDDHHDKDDHGH